jgi:hypothetical protein
VGLRAELPEFVTHYYLAGRRPFLSLSELSDAELAEVLADLRALRQAGKQQRPFGPRHIELRCRTEAQMRELFAAADGDLERPAPYYFVLGDSPWFEGLAENMARVQLSLSALPPMRIRPRRNGQSGPVERCCAWTGTRCSEHIFRVSKNFNLPPVLLCYSSPSKPPVPQHSRIRSALNGSRGTKSTSCLSSDDFRIPRS